MNIFTKLENIASNNTKETIPQSMIMSAFNSSDHELKGIAYTIISTSTLSKNIKPCLSFNDYFHYVNDYIQYCIIENPDGDWSDSRYSACWDYANWFNCWFNSKGIDVKYLEIIKENIEKLYKNSDSEIQLAIETGFLEHILRNKKTIDFFSNWSQDEILSEVIQRCRLN